MNKDVPMRISWSSLLLMLGMLAGCYPKGDPSKPIPTVLVPAQQQPAHRLVVVLPGRGDDIAGLRQAGIAAAIQSQWSDADVVLSGLALDYYMKGGAMRRLHDEIIAPARSRGYREVWLLGASLGGLGALMYDNQWPGTIDGMVLMAPYLGEKPLLQQIAREGGIARWDPGPMPERVDGHNFQHELWRGLKTWSGDPSRSRNVWLAYGDKDYLRDTMPALTPLLPTSQVLVRPGSHSWTVWTPASVEILAAINARRTQLAP
jgi:hypothetical protein